jgi:hypothetical protein
MAVAKKTVRNPVGRPRKVPEKTRIEENLEKQQALIQTITKDMADRGVNTVVRYHEKIDAEKMGVSVHDIGQLMNGHKTLSDPLAFALSPILGLAPVTLLHRAGKIDQTYFKIPGDELFEALKAGWAAIEADPRWGSFILKKTWDTLDNEVKIFIIAMHSALMNYRIEEVSSQVKNP